MESLVTSTRQLDWQAKQAVRSIYRQLYILFSYLAHHMSPLSNCTEFQDKKKEGKNDRKRQPPFTRTIPARFHVYHLALYFML